MRSAVCAICKNERHYVLEWIAWQKSVGFDEIFIYDNVSDDGTSELLVALHELGVITRIHWPRRDGVPPQREAYAHFTQDRALDFDWVFICDLDEFLFLKSGQVKDFVSAAILAQPDASAIAIPWLMFGSGGAEHRQDGLVVKRFTKCEASVDGHVKSLFRPQNIYNMRTHICDLLTGSYIDNTFSLPAWSNEAPISLASPAPGQAVVHHYFTKSREEWLARRAIGKADRAAHLTRNLIMFDAYHDLPVENLEAAMMEPALQARIAEFKAEITERFSSLQTFQVRLVALNRSWILCLTEGLPPNTRLRVVVNGRHEIITRNTRVFAQGVSGIAVNVRWIETAVEEFTVAPLGALNSAVFTREHFLPRHATLGNTITHAPAAEQIIFDYFVKLSNTQGGLARAREMQPYNFNKFAEYGDLIHGILTHETSPESLRDFLIRYRRKHGKMGRAALEAFASAKHYVGDLIAHAGV